MSQTAAVAVLLSETPKKMTPQEFKTILIDSRRRMYAVAVAILGDSDDAADAVQDAYVRLWSRRDSLDGVASAEGYCMVVTKHVCLDRLRASRLTERLDDLPAAESLSAEPDDMTGRESVDIVTSIIDLLPEPYRRFIRLSAINSLSNSDIASLTGYTEGNVRQILSRARKRIKELYQQIDK